MYIIRSLKPIWELFSIILNWALIIVPILFICCIGAIAFHHYIIDKDSDDIGKKVCYKKRIKKVWRIFYLYLYYWQLSELFYRVLLDYKFIIIMKITYKK